MVLNELGSRIGAALAAMSNATVIDEAVLDTCLKAICTALLQVRRRVLHSKLMCAEQQLHRLLCVPLTELIVLFMWMSFAMCPVVL
jgi:SRP54-type protein, helical bundle domain